MDPEPGRCRRTDGKKWRCSRDVVGGYKYCDRHMHRGRNRSRKPVEVPTHSSTAAPLASNNNISTINNSTVVSINSNINQAIAAQAPTATTFGLSRPSHSFDLLHLNHRYFYFLFLNFRVFPLYVFVSHHVTCYLSQ